MNPHPQGGLLLLAATEKEMAPLRRQPEFLQLQRQQMGRLELLVTGVGQVATAIRLCRWLALRAVAPGGLRVVQFGVGGGWAQQGAQLLRLCIAEREIFADLGVAAGEEVEYLDRTLAGDPQQPLDTALFAALRRLLPEALYGSFVSVNGISATPGRCAFYHRRWQALCENMEGAAAAAVCREAGFPFGEVRAISNLVGDRTVSGWKLEEACEVAAAAAVKIATGLLS